MTDNAHNAQGRPRSTPDLSGVAFTATVDRAGTLGAVAGLFAKLLAAARERSFPRIHTLIAARSQTLNGRSLTDPRAVTDLGLVRDQRTGNILSDPNDLFQVLLAESVEEALRDLDNWRACLTAV